jgi:hypothetical protein
VQSAAEKSLPGSGRSPTADADLRRCRFLVLSKATGCAQAADDAEVGERGLAPLLKQIEPWAVNRSESRDTVERGSRRR